MNNLKLMVKELAQLNNVFDFEFSSLSDLNEQYDLGELEKQAAKIREVPGIEQEFLDGEYHIVKDIVIPYSVQLLNDYLNKVFERL